jgi:hypothetical protein
VIGKTILNLYGNVLDCADGSSSTTTPGNPADRAGSKTGLPKFGGAVVSTTLSSALAGLGAISGQNNEFNNSLLGSLTSVFGA